MLVAVCLICGVMFLCLAFFDHDFYEDYILGGNSITATTRAAIEKQKQVETRISKTKLKQRRESYTTVHQDDRNDHDDDHDENTDPPTPPPQPTRSRSHSRSRSTSTRSSRSSSRRPSRSASPHVTDDDILFPHEKDPGPLPKYIPPSPSRIISTTTARSPTSTTRTLNTPKSTRSRSATPPGGPVTPDRMHVQPILPSTLSPQLLTSHRLPRSSSFSFPIPSSSCNTSPSPSPHLSVSPEPQPQHLIPTHLTAAPAPLPLPLAPRHIRTHSSPLQPFIPTNLLPSPIRSRSPSLSSTTNIPFAYHQLTVTTPDKSAASPSPTASPSTTISTLSQSPPSNSSLPPRASPSPSRMAQHRFSLPTLPPLSPDDTTALKSEREVL